MSIKLEILRKYIREMVKEELKEASVTGNIDGGEGPPKTPYEQKIGRSMREVRDSLSGLERLVKMNVRLKNELNVDSRSYWKNTHKALHKISERLVKLANKVGQLQ